MSIMNKALLAVAACGLGLVPSVGRSAVVDSAEVDQTARAAGFRGCPSGPPAPALVPLQAEPAARLFADEPIPSHLAEGRVVIQYCVENLRILPVFGEPALAVSPRLGHLHVTVNQGPWRWLDTSGQPIIVNLLPPGKHSILLELVDATHRTLDKQLVSFVIPPKRIANVEHGGHDARLP
jgi:hypothetical protein